MQRPILLVGLWSTALAVILCTQPARLQADASNWRVSFDALFLDRDAPSPAPPAAPPQDFEEEWNIGFDVQSRFRLKIFHDVNPCESWEVSYMTNDWNFSETVFSPAGNINRITGTQDFLQADLATARYVADLQSIEINKHFHSYCDFSYFVGFRALWLDEDFTFTSKNAAMQTTSTYAIETSNGLYGGQIGGKYYRWLNCNLQLSVTSKAGLFLKSARQRVVLRDQNNTVVLANYRNSETDASFVGEIDANVTYRLFHGLALRAGYQLLWLENVALALEQTQNNVAAFPAPINASGSLFAYGAYVGVESNW